MAIRIRRGNQADFEKNKLVQGELAIVLDAGELHFCYGLGNTKRLATKEDLQEMLDMSDTSYSAFIQLIADLEANPNELTNILSNIYALGQEIDTLTSNFSTSSSSYNIKLKNIDGRPYISFKEVV